MPVQHGGPERLERIETGAAPIVVREHQHDGAGRVLEMVADALFLEQARQEIEITLAVLHAIGTRSDVVEPRHVADTPHEAGLGDLEGIVKVGRERGIGLALEQTFVLAEHGLDDRPRGLLEKDAALDAVRGARVGRRERGVIERAVGRRAQVLGLDDKAVKAAHRGMGVRRDARGGEAADELAWIDGARPAVGVEHELDLKGARQRVGDAQRDDAQVVPVFIAAFPVKYEIIVKHGAPPGRVRFGPVDIAPAASMRSERP